MAARYLRGVLMYREVLFFQWLLNGWQYFTDYKASEAVCREFIAAGQHNDSSQHLYA